MSERIKVALLGAGGRGTGFAHTIKNLSHLAEIVAVAEPRETILQLLVEVDGQAVAYETLVLGALREGYRAVPLRSNAGTPIEGRVAFAAAKCTNAQLKCTNAGVHKRMGTSTSPSTRIPIAIPTLVYRCVAFVHLAQGEEPYTPTSPTELRELVEEQRLEIRQLKSLLGMEDTEPDSHASTDTSTEAQPDAQLAVRATAARKASAGHAVLACAGHAVRATVSRWPSGGRRP